MTFILRSRDRVALDLAPLSSDLVPDSRPCLLRIMPSIPLLLILRIMIIPIFIIKKNKTEVNIFELLTMCQELYVLNILCYFTVISIKSPKVGSVGFLDPIPL